MKDQIRFFAFVLLTVLIVAACGQKSGVHVATGQGTVLSESGGSGEAGIDPVTGEPIAEGETGGTGSGSSGETGGTTAGTTGGAVKALAGDKNGVFPDKIVVGFHAPLTGAAAVPLIDIQKGVNLYRDWLNSKGVKIHGRVVDTIFRDDQYNPSHAVEVCREMVEQRKVFMLVGGAGTDQIIACARYAASKGVPYLSAGVTERVVSRLKNYFAFTMSYPDQSKPLAEMIKNFTFKGDPVLKDRCPDGAGASADAFCGANGPASSAKVAIVYSNTDGFYDARDTFLQEWKAVSGKDAKAFSITKFSLGTPEANTLVQKLKGDGYDVVYILTAPTNWLTILRVAEGQRYAPRWVGIGLTKGINTVATAACGQSSNSFNNSLFLNPWMTVDSAAHNSQFNQAWTSFGDRTAPREHDIAFGLWGGSVVQHALFESAGPDLSRSNYINKIQGLQNVKAPDNTKAGDIIDIYSSLSYSPTNHFGAQQAHLIFGDCANARWSDVKQFVTGF